MLTKHEQGLEMVRNVKEEEKNIIGNEEFTGIYWHLEWTKSCAEMLFVECEIYFVETIAGI